MNDSEIRKAIDIAPERQRPPPVFLMRCWYAAAWSDELAPGAVLARTVLDEPLMLVRDGRGHPAALFDRCPHRFAPLSRGKLEGAAIRCGYHGLAFDLTSGHCVHNPHGPITRHLAVPAYPAVERHHLLWIWMGDPSAADQAEIPDLSFSEQLPPHSFSKGYMAAAAGHKLLEDNILDLSHADYLHADTLGGCVTGAETRVEERERSIHVQWRASGTRTIPTFRGEMPSPDTPTDTTFDVVWHPNGVMLLEIDVNPSTSPDHRGVRTANFHIMTPETTTSTHYFYFNARNYRLRDAEFNERRAALIQDAFEREDRSMIEAQQRRLRGGDVFDNKPALQSIDIASTRARRLYSRLLQEETVHDLQQGGAASAAG